MEIQNIASMKYAVDLVLCSLFGMGKKKQNNESEWYPTINSYDIYVLIRISEPTKCDVLI